MRHSVVLFVLLLVGSDYCEAQSIRWEPVNGPSSALPSLVAINTNGHVVAQFKHLWWTSDRGDHWKEYALNAAVRDSGTQTRTILTFGRSGRAFVSQVDLSDVEASHLFRIAEDQEFADTLRRDHWRALTSDSYGRVIAVTRDSVFITSDEGSSWTSSACPRSESINSIASNGNSALVLATETGLFLSTDLGQSWRRVLSGITQGHYTEVQWKSGRFWALGDSAYYSDDNGRSWSLMPVPAAGGRELLHLAANADREIAAVRNLRGERTTAFIRGSEILESRLEGTGNGRYAIAIDSSGQVWSVLGASKDGYASVAPLAWSAQLGDTNWHLAPVPSARASLFGTARGLVALSGDNVTYQHLTPYPYLIYASSDSGRSWATGGQFNPNDVVIFADASGMLYKSTREGTLSYSKDLGVTWTPFNAAFPANVKLTATSWRGALYAASRGVFQSLDSGATWSQIDDGSLTSDVLTLKSTDSVLVAATSVGLFISPNGASWTKVANSFNAQALSTSQHSIVATRDSLILYSTNNGRVWNSTRYKERIHDAAVDSTGGLLLATAHGMSYLPVGGKLFLPLNDNLGDRDVADIALLPSGEIFVSKNGEGIYRATGSLPRLRVEDRTTTQSISVFPNPAASVLQIRTANAGVVAQVMCTDAVGRTVSLPCSEDGVYDVRNLKDGAYLIRLVSTTGVTTGRVIIKH